MSDVITFSRDRSYRKKQRKFLRICEAQNWRCCYCGQRTEWASNLPNGASREHITARYAGGTSVYRNLVMACKRCNNSRGHGDAFAFFRGVQVGMAVGSAR